MYLYEVVISIGMCLLLQIIAFLMLFDLIRFNISLSSKETIGMFSYEVWDTPFEFWSSITQGW
mgnify:CR=1 FL=1